MPERGCCFRGTNSLAFETPHAGLSLKGLFILNSKPFLDFYDGQIYCGNLLNGILNNHDFYKKVRIGNNTELFKDNPPVCGPAG